MPFWTTQRIRQELLSQYSPIINANHDRVNNACYEMSLAGESFITSLDKTKQKYVQGDQIRIPPGQFALLLTEEEVRIPLNVLSFISIKASKKISGLLNVSGFHVDPGFRGRLKFSVYNAGSESILLDVGKPLFPIWFCQLPEETEDEYVGRHLGQMEISSEDVMRLQGDMASPAALKREIDELRSTITNWKAATIGALLTSVATAIAAIFAAVMKLGS